MRRHDLVWLDHAASQAAWRCAPEHAAATREWMARRLPLVVARRPQPAPPGCDDWLKLGFTLPGRGPRQRVCVDASPDCILRWRPPLALDEAIDRAPAAWQAELRRLLAAFHAAGLTPRIYGSLVTEIFCGEACLRPDSDVDLIVDCRDTDDAAAALAVLRDGVRTNPGTRLRLDGELRLPSGWAVAWRELLEARDRPDSGRVLAKSDTAVALLDPRALLTAPAHWRSA